MTAFIDKNNAANDNTILPYEWIKYTEYKGKTIAKKVEEILQNNFKVVELFSGSDIEKSTLHFVCKVLNIANFPIENIEKIRQEFEDFVHKFGILKPENLTKFDYFKKLLSHYPSKEIREEIAIDITDFIVDTIYAKFIKILQEGGMEEKVAERFLSSIEVPDKREWGEIISLVKARKRKKEGE